MNNHSRRHIAAAYVHRQGHTGAPPPSLRHVSRPPLGGTLLKGPGATWLPAELRKHPACSPALSPKLGGLGPGGGGGLLPTPPHPPGPQGLGPKSCLQALAGSCTTCPSTGASGSLSPVSPWLQAQAQPTDLFLWGRMGTVAPLSLALGTGGQRGHHWAPAICATHPRRRCTELGT